jgi:hypothetical protein
MDLSWIDLNHTPLEWALFAAAVLGLILLKIYLHKKRNEILDRPEY